MRSLFEKEIRSARPFLALVIFFMALNWVFMLLAEYPDQYPLSKLLDDESRSSTQIVIFILAFALAAGLLVRERDEGTLDFLDALPVTRARIFFAKCTVALGLLWLLPFMDLIFNATFHALSRTSLETRFHWNTLLTVTLLDAASCVIYLSLGLALSFLRRFSLLVLGLLVWIFVLLQELDFPFVSLLDIFSLSDPVFEGQRWLWPWSKLGAQLTLAGMCLAIAFAVFQFTGDGAQRIGARIQRGRIGALLAGLGIAALVVVWLGLMVYFARKSDIEEGPKVHYTQWATARATSERYQFLYPENRHALVSELIGRADSVEEKVREFLGAPPLDRIVVDMTMLHQRHAGRAYWKKVQMNLPFDASEAGVESLLSVLGHETTHVYLEHLSDARLQEKFESTRFFHEGLASYVEYHLFRPLEQLAPLRRVAAVTQARADVKFEELMEDTRLGQRHDRDLVYPLGEVFVAALVRRYGETAPGRIVRAFARKDAPPGLKGFALWQDTFQACGFDLSGVTDEFFAELDRSAAEHRAFIDSLPRLRGVVDQDEDDMIVRGLHEGPAPGKMVCRFRSRSDVDARFYLQVWADDDQAFRVGKFRLSERSFWYQLGWQVSEASQVIYEPWVEARLKP